MEGEWVSRVSYGRGPGKQSFIWKGNGLTEFHMEGERVHMEGEWISRVSRGRGLSKQSFIWKETGLADFHIEWE